MEDPRAGLAGLADCLPELVAELERRVPRASFLVTEDEGLAIRSNGKKTSIETPLPETGITLRLANGGEFVEFGTNLVEPARLRAWALAAAQAARLDPDGGAAAEREPLSADFETPVEIEPASVPAAVKLAAVDAVRRQLLDLDPAAVSAQVVYDESRVTKLYVDRRRRLSQRLCFVGLAYWVYLAEGGVTRHGHGGNKRSGGYELVEQLADRAELAATVAEARTALRAERIQPGVYPLVAAPLVAGVIGHEAFGHGVETDMVLKRCARAAEYFGRPVASPLVSFYDAPDCHSSAGFAYFDDEGELARPTPIIRDGILVGGMSDAFSAAALGRPRSPNGRRESFRRKVYARMTNTYFAPGASDPAAILRSVEHGIYLAGGGSGMEDPLGWGIQIEVQSGLEIRHGELTGKVYGPLVLTGYVPDLLTSIAAVGNDLRTYGFGRCGKTFRKDWILVGMGGPTLLLEGRLG